MASLREQFETSGTWLFRWRSYLPLLLAGLVLASLEQFEYPGHSHAWDLAWELLCLTLSLAGLAIRAYTTGHTPKGTSGRNTKRQRAAALNISGAYSLVRHPLYLGNFLCWLGISMFPRTWWASVIFILAFWLYYERIMFAEEEFLRRSFGTAYEQWALRTPAFLPRRAGWRPPELSFSARTVLKREPSSWLAVVAAFSVMELVGDLVAEGRLELDLFWLILFSLSLLLYTILRVLKKQKRLDVAGR